MPAIEEIPVEKFIKHFKHLGYTVDVDVFNFYVNFYIYEQFYWDDTLDVPTFYKAGDDSHSEYVSTIEESERYLSGSVKWDGCSNWTFDEIERGMALHGCSRQDLTDIGEIMALCWDMAEAHCPKWV